MSKNSKLTAKAGSDKVIPIRSQDGKRLAGSISLSGKKAPEAKASSIVNPSRVENKVNESIPVFPATEEDTVSYHIISSHSAMDLEGYSVRPDFSKLNPIDYHNKLHEANAYRVIHEHAPAVLEEVETIEEYSKIVPATDLLEYAVHYYEGTREEKDMDEESAKDSIYSRKLEEAKASGLYEDIRLNGVKVPVEIRFGNPDYPEGLVADGHHRLIVAVDLGLNVPANFSNRP